MPADGDNPGGGPDPLLEEVRDRLLQRVHPQPTKIIAFGSRARGDARPDSDLDLIVVMDLGGQRGRRGRRVYPALWDLGVAVDVIVYTPEEYALYRTYPSSVAHIAEREGTVLHG